MEKPVLMGNFKVPHSPQAELPAAPQKEAAEGRSLTEQMEAAAKAKLGGSTTYVHLAGSAIRKPEGKKNE